MASPLQSGKKSVNLASPVRVSRIRRDPPPVAKKVELRDPEEIEARTVLIGVVSFALAIVIIVIGISSNYGWSPADYNIEL
jgi:hypothetical protein